MSTYSLSDGIAADAGRSAQAQSRSRAQNFIAWALVSGPGMAAGAAWAAFGISCLLWNDLGDWSRTHSLGIGAFVVAAVALLGTRSEEHTSELQSQSNLVCRLLLEKKKN